MNKTEIFYMIVDKVCELCDVDKDLLMAGSRGQDYVDARTLAVQYLRRVGFSNEEIALAVLKWQRADAITTAYPEVKRKAKGIAKEFDSYSRRCLESYVFRILSAELSRWCRDKYAELYGN